MAEGPEAPATDLPAEDKPERTEKVVQMSCRMPNCHSTQHYEKLGAGGAPQRVYECIGCGNVWSANLGGNPGF